MGAQPYRDLADYRAEADACAAAFVAAGTSSPLRYLTATGVPEAEFAGTFSEIEIEGAQFVHAVALAQVWRSYGIVADLTVGHSLGEVGAAYVAGTITLHDAVAIIAARAGVVDRLPGQYAVAVLGIGMAAAAEVIAATPGWLELAVVNASSSVAVAGDRDAIAEAVRQVRAQGRFAREITVGFPVHTSILEPLRDEVLTQLSRSEFVDAPVQFIGGATGQVVPSGTPFAQYWYGNLRNMVRFDQAFQTAIGCGARTFVEMSANPSLLFAMGDILGDTPGVLIGSGRRDEEFTAALSSNIATAAVADPAFDWRSTVVLGKPAPGKPLRGFPNAPMRDTRLWATSERLRPPPTTPGLTVAQEDWQRIALPSGHSAPAAPVARIGVLDLGDRQSLTGPLRAAIGGHAAAMHTGPRDAEILIVIAPTIDTTDTTAATAQLTALIDTGLLTYPAAIGTGCRDVWLVTVAGERVRVGEPVALPGPAALAAMHRSLGFEHPEQNFHHLDLTATDLTAQQATLVIDTVVSATGELALRDDDEGSALYRRCLSDAPSAPALALDSGLLDNVVITGGAGAIGLAHARYFAERGATRIVLLSRRGADPAALAALSARHGTEVLAPACDITDPEQLAGTAAEFGTGGATLLIHAAGTATFAAGDRVDALGFADTFAAKVTGLTLMTQLWPLRPHARILLCSSASGVWGGQGHAAYSAANRMLDVLAAQLRQRGRHCVAMRWGLWKSSEEGPAGIVDAAETARIERSGLRPMAPNIAIEASLRDYLVDPIVLAGDPHRLRIFFDSIGSATARRCCKPGRGKPARCKPGRGKHRPPVGNC